MGGAANGIRYRTWAAACAYTVIFAACAAPWLRVADRAVPTTLFSNATDERLVVALLAWGAHALTAQPAALYDLPINHPAPAQLTGSEHLLSAQLLFAPLFRLTGNPVLAANLCTFAALPLAATAMYWLLCGLGCRRLVAFAGGCALALGAVQVPAHLHLLQYAALFFPLAAGALTRLRRRPDLPRAIGLATVLLVAFFSSYYTFVLVSVVAGIWCVAEWWRPDPGRARFLLLAAAAAAVATLALGAFSLLYASRPETEQLLSPPSSLAANQARATLAKFYSSTSGPLLRVLALVGIAALASRSPAARLAAGRGLVLVVAGGLCMLGPAQRIGGVDVPLPFAALAASPLGFVRYAFRFIGVVSFGRALLVAGALEALRALLPTRLGRAAVLAVTALIVAVRGPLIAGHATDPIVSLNHAAYRMVARVTEGAEGPLLELPVTAATPGGWGDGDALIGQIRHGLPLVAGHTGYQPAHRALVDQAVARLPAVAAIQSLVDLTHVRWLLLRPQNLWPAKRRHQRAAILEAPWASVAGRADGWVLLRVELEPQHDEYYTAIARGWRPGSTAMGAPAAPLAADEARAELAGELPRIVASGRSGGVRLTATNRGAATWPVTVPTFARLGAPYRGEVYVEAAWRPLDHDTDAAPLVQQVQLPQDVPPGESIAFGAWLTYPRTPGRYRLAVAVRQRNGEGFSRPDSTVLEGVVDVQ